MWWYAYGWWWWWIGFLLLFFLLPLAYGWGYRGWGPWYRRRGGDRGLAPPRETDADRYEPIETGWGWLGIALWIALLIAIGWAIAAWGWGNRYY